MKTTPHILWRAVGIVVGSIFNVSPCRKVFVWKQWLFCEILLKDWCKSLEWMNYILVIKETESWMGLWHCEFSFVCGSLVYNNIYGTVHMYERDGLTYFSEPPNPFFVRKNPRGTSVQWNVENVPYGRLNKHLGTLCTNLFILFYEGMYMYFHDRARHERWYIRCARRCIRPCGTFWRVSILLTDICTFSWYTTRNRKFSLSLTRAILVRRKILASYSNWM
jgi:hypothetical protein